MNINGDVMRKLLAALSLCLVATDLLSQGISGKAGIAHVANSDATASTASGSSITLLMGTSLAAGQSIVLCVFSGNRRDVTFTVTDNGPVAGSNSYSTDRSQNLATKGGTIAVLHADNISIAGHNPATLTITPSGTGSIFAVASAYSGLTSSSFDKTNSANSRSKLPDSGSSGFLSQADELVFGCMATAARSGDTISAGSGFTLRNTAGRQRIASEDQVVNSKAGINATFSQAVSREWATIVTTFK